MSRTAGFNDAADVIGREPNTQVEVTLGYCTEVNGTLPCTASPPTALKCYNTFYTCQDEANFSGDEKTYYFTEENAKPEPGTGAGILYPCITKVDVAPTKLTPAEGLGQVAKATVTMLDFTTDDIDTDPYISDRDYIARENGTYFGKFFARNPYYEGRDMVVKFRYGSDYVSQKFIIDKFALNNRGQVSLIGKDPLKLAEGLKTQIPEANDGTLTAAITGTPATFSVGSGDGDQYTTGSNFWVRIDDEIIEVTRSGDTFTVVTRGDWATTSADHSSGATVQECVGWEASDLDDVVYDILVDHMGIPSANIPTTDWQAEFNTWLSNVQVTNIISEPTDARDLLDQLLIESGINIWWDAIAEEVKFKADVPVLPADPPILEYNDDDIIQRSLSIKQDSKKRVSQFWFYCNRKSYIEDEEKPSNYTDLIIRADIDSEGANEYGSKTIRKVYCRWIDETIAGQTASRYRSRLKHPPREVTFRLDPKDSDLETGQHFVLESRDMQLVDGLPAVIEFDTVGIDYDWQKQQIIVNGLQFRYDAGRGAIVNDNSAPDYTSATTAERLKAYVCDSTTFKMSNGDDPYTVI